MRYFFITTTCNISYCVIYNKYDNSCKHRIVFISNGNDIYTKN